MYCIDDWHPSTIPHPDEQAHRSMTVDPTMPWGIYVQPSLVKPGPKDADVRTHEKAKLEVVQHQQEDDEVDGLQNNIEDRTHHHDGYIRIIDAKGKFFQCGFSRPIGSVMEVASTGNNKNKRSHSQIMEMVPTLDMTSCCDDDASKNNNCGHDDGIVVDAPTTGQSTQNEAQPTEVKKTITEERLHPEEALFLHMRGLIRIDTEMPSQQQPVMEQAADDNSPTQETKKTSTSPATTTTKYTTTMSTQDLFTKMLPECNIPLAAYLAYAHLRAQGYNLIRYSENRLGLLGEMEMMNMRRQQQRQQQQQHNGDDDTLHDQTKLEQEKQQIDMPEQNTDKEESAVTIMNEDGSTTTSATANNNNTRYYSKERQLKTRLSNDVATSPPPCNGMSGSSSDNSDVVRMAYYAYNPNARFRRSNPGLPDFGVAVMSFHSSDNSDNNSHDTNGPTFDVLQSLVAACEGKGRDDQLLLNNNEDDGSDNGGGKRGNENGSSTANNNTTGIPLRVVTVADSGAVIAFGVTNGDVPSINN